MSKTLDEKMIKNQAIMRVPNTNTSNEFAALRKMAKEENQSDLPGLDAPVPFACECSDEDCHQRIMMKPTTYEKIHKNSKSFIIRPGHEVPDIEEITQSHVEYIVVRKFKEPSQKAGKLSKTNLHNA